MKKLLLTSFAASVLSLQANAQVFVPVPVTGFTADVIADGAGAAIASTTADVDGGGYAFVAQDYVAPLGQIPTSYLPNGGLINSAATPGMSFQFAPYAGNNSLRLTASSSTGTLTFTTPRTADFVNLLVTSANPSTFTATVNFSDATSQTFAGNTVDNWYDGLGTIAIQGISRVHIGANAVQFSAVNPRLFQYSLALSAANKTKTIQSVTITKTSTAATEILHVFAVTASTLLPNDIGISAITAPTSPVLPGSQPVTVTVKNYGSSPLTSATLGFSVDGTTVVNNFALNPSPALASNAVSAPVTIGNFSFTPGPHTVKAWTRLPNGVVDAGKTNDTVQVSINACNALSGSYTINKNAPASATNFTTFSAVSQAFQCGVVGPVTITVAPNSGPYNEQVTFPVIPGASATNTITLEGNGNTVATNTTTAANPGVIILTGADYLKLNNFKVELQGQTTSAGCGIQLINASDYVTISNCIIDIPIATAAAAVNGILAGPTNSATGNFTNNSKFQNNTVIGGFYGILLQGGGGLIGVNNQITGNQVRDMYFHGIFVKNASNTLVEGNDVSRATRSYAAAFQGITLGGTTMNSVVSKNRIHNSHDAATYMPSDAIGIDNQASATPGNENIIKNNIIYKINNSGGNFTAFTSALGKGAFYYHNTVAADPTISYNQLRGLSFPVGSTSSNIKFINNILSLESNAVSKYGIYIGNSTVSLTSNNNDIYLGTLGIIGYYISNQVTLANWQAANNNAYDQNSVELAPGFVDYAKGNLKPTNPLVNNLGQPVAAVTDDYVGTARPAIPDFGAFEFNVYPNDVGISAISGPNIAACGLTAAETITVTIKNYGTTTQTTVPVNFAVNGTALTTPETFTGSIAPNATATYTFTAKANLSASGPHVITARTVLASDQALTNDTDTLNLVNSFIAGMPVTINFETPTTDLSHLRQVVNSKSNIKQSTVASHGTGSTKGIILDGIRHPAWIPPGTAAAPWVTNPDNFAAVYFCVSTAGTGAKDSLQLSFDLSQVYQQSNAYTNFRVTVNGAQVGPTYWATNAAGTIGIWKRFKLDLTPYKAAPTLTIGLESSVSEPYRDGFGGANLLDNILVQRKTVVNGVKSELLQSQVNVFPNPGNGTFNIDLPKDKTYKLEVTDLTGKVIQKQISQGGIDQISLEKAAKGIYLLKVSGENGSAVRKLIVE